MMFWSKQTQEMPRVDAQSEAVAAIIQGAAILPSKRLTAAIYMGVLDNRDMTIEDIEALANRLSRLAWERART